MTALASTLAVDPSLASADAETVHAVVVDSPRESQLLARAGFEAVQSTAAERVEAVADGHLTRDVAVSDLAVRVLRAAECLDDPTTSLLANLDTLLDDLREGIVNLDDAEDLVADCVSAVSGLAAGLECLKAVAAPHIDIVDHTGEVSVDLALRDAVRHLRTTTANPPVDLPAITGLRAHGDRPSLGRAFSDLLEVFACRLRHVPGGRVRVEAVRGKGVLRVILSDGGGPFPTLAADLLSGRARPDSQEGLALLAARSLLEAVGGEVRVGLVAGKGAIEVHLRDVE